MKTKQQNQKPSKMVQMLRMLAPKAQKLPQVIKTNGIYPELTSYNSIGMSPFYANSSNLLETTEFR